MDTLSRGWKVESKFFFSVTACDDGYGETLRRYMISPIDLKTWERTRGFEIFLKKCLSHAQQTCQIQRNMTDLRKQALNMKTIKNNSTYEHCNGPK